MKVEVLCQLFKDSTISLIKEDTLITFRSVTYVYVTLHILWHTKYNPRWWLIKWNGMSVVDCHYEDYSTGRRRRQSGTPLNLRKTSNFSTKTSGKSAMPTFVHVFRVSLWHATNFIRRWSELCRIESRARPKSSSFLFSPLLRYRAQRRESITFRRSCTSADRSALTCKCASKGRGGRGKESGISALFCTLLVIALQS